jgi:UDP-N-acetyl-2-amino-2-deoxyglucuronate dehydrogenase
MAQSGGLGFGIVGIGSIANTHARAIRAMDGGHLACLFSRRGGERADAVAREHGVRCYTDYAEFLRHPGLDAVVVATPSGAHMEPAVAAAEAGKHVVSEKPLEVTLERCDAMIAACARGGVLLGGIFQSRTAEAAIAIRAALEEGRLGRPTLCSAAVPWFRAQAYYDSADWRGTWALDGGGALMNQAVHTLDLVRWFLGPVREVAAFAGCLAHDRIEVEDAAVAALRFASGALAVFSASTAMWPGSPAEILLSGTNGTVRLVGGHVTQWQLEPEGPQDAGLRAALAPPREGAKGGASDPKAIGIVGHQRQLEDFARAVASGRAPIVDGVEARKAVEIALAIYASASERRPVLLPLAATPRLAPLDAQ